MCLFLQLLFVSFLALAIPTSPFNFMRLFLYLLLFLSFVVLGADHDFRLTVPMLGFIRNDVLLEIKGERGGQLITIIIEYYSCSDRSILLGPLR